MVVVLDAIAGASVVALGILGWQRFRASAVFAFAAAGAWFLVPAVPSLALLHRPLLLHSFLVLPRRGVRGVVPGGLVVVAWVGAVLPTAAQPWVSVTTAALCVAVSAGLRAPKDSAAGVQPDVVATRRALLLLAAGLVLPMLERAVWPRYAEAGLPISTYLCAVTLCSAAMIHGILTLGRQETDAVIELSERTPVEALAELRRLADAEPDARRSDALRSAVALLEDNERLQRNLAERIEEVRASRGRLIDAAIGERQRLERLLAEGALRYLGELEECLTSTAGHAQGDPMVVSCLEEIARTREDLEQLARGLHPRVLADRGLAAALEELSRRSPVPVEVCAPPGRFAERTETAVWYACAEALANVWKHAQATEVVIHVEESQGALRATIHDDGVGGAQLTSGGGLTGLVDRLADVDGRLALTTDPGGTDVTITVPLR